MNVRYLNLKTVAKQENLKKTLIIIGMVVADFNLFGVALNIIDFSGFGLGFFGFHFVIGCLIFWWGLMVGKRIDFARRLETIFGSDQDGIVTIGEIATLMNKPGGKIRASMAGLFKKKYFVNCSFQRDPQPAVVIYDAINQDVNNGVGFVMCVCPNCGTQNRIRAGSMGKCIACQAPISGVLK